MKKLLSLPPNLVGWFHDITGYPKSEWFCTNDPIDHKLGSGGGTTWLLTQAYENEMAHSDANNQKTFDEWLSSEKRLLLHAGGQSRRLPAYAPSGKVLTPVPVFRWERGQRLSQDLLSLQIPLYKKIMDAAPSSLHTMIVSGDVLIRTTQPLQPIPEADVVCYGLWLGPEIAKNHGVFVSSCDTPSVLKCMLQKPSPATLGTIQKDHYYLTDIGIWLLSDKAVKVLMSHKGEYDLYSEFGGAMGTEPTLNDEAVKELKVAILPLSGGEFYHFGTSHELLSSTLAIQNLVNDQRLIMHHSRKPHPCIFIQNSITKKAVDSSNEEVWIENSYISEGWNISQKNIITGVPKNNWNITLAPGQCIDIVPMGETQYVVRPYGFNDRFAGEEQQRPQFPIVDNIDEAGLVLRYMLNQETEGEDKGKGKAIFEKAQKISAEQISATANLRRLFEQRREFRKHNWSALADNYEHSVFYQLDLNDAAKEFKANGIAMPKPLPDSAPLLTRMKDAMFRGDNDKAFGLLREGIVKTSNANGINMPTLSSMSNKVATDQIVWGRSPVRIDIAGGWTDTPPFCLMEGGSVVNLAIELNGQQPIQTYVKPCREHHVVLKSIDLGASEIVETYEQLADFKRVGSPFSIPKAALALAGFLPQYSQEKYPDLKSQLMAFGCGIEITLLSAIPAGSGLGTSSVLAATVLGTINDFLSLGWDKNEICHKTLVLEQLLTTGGGWQDQFGGVLQGVKLLQTCKGFEQQPIVHWLPTDLYTQPEYQACHLLYYTGITRTAKTILAEIVQKMFLNDHDQVALLREMKAHSLQMYEAIQRNDFKEMGKLVGKTWLQNQAIDAGTNPLEIKKLTDLIDDLCLGYKLPGAGGGGYLYMVAKDPEAAARIKVILNANRPNGNARFVGMSLSKTGLQVSRS
ncbi:MAG: bifunctional fucokinase/fucose-1-phosphate guanylyltransferase [Prevotella sp.]|nr:bifunctional fucokinase/fucose-1-phosphate guanylyltransferase [Prevotella sp.]MDY4150859.1 bifunctional fucokinase/fucose-1-phosphate guanylyltransferase [Prevotella sp.]